MEKNYNERLLDKAILEVTNDTTQEKSKVPVGTNEIIVPLITGYSKETLKMKKKSRRIVMCYTMIPLSEKVFQNTQK